MQPSPQAHPGPSAPLVEDGQEPPTSKRVRTFTMPEIKRKYLDVDLDVGPKAHLPTPPTLSTFVHLLTLVFS